MRMTQSSRLNSLQSDNLRSAVLGAGPDTLTHTYTQKVEQAVQWTWWWKTRLSIHGLEKKTTP